MKEVTLVFILKGDEVLLAMKKRGHGVGWWNGPGGKLEEGESAEAAAKRETLEEVGVVLNSLEKRGTIEFMFAGDQKDYLSHIYTSRDFSGEPTETEEMKPEWFKLRDIPWQQMWEGDDLWIPKVLNGESISLRLYFDEHLKFVRLEDLNKGQDS